MTSAAVLDCAVGPRILGDEQFRQLTTDEKYLYINQVLRYIVASRPGARAPAQLVAAKRERIVNTLSQADYASLGDTQKIEYLENLIDELITTVNEAQQALNTLRSGVPVGLRS